VATTRMSLTQLGTGKRVLSRLRSDVFGLDSVDRRPVTKVISAHREQILRLSALHRSDSEGAGGKQSLLLTACAEDIPPEHPLMSFQEVASPIR
jgi:hypothetical protein